MSDVIQQTEIGKKLRAARFNRHLGVGELARLAGVNERTITRIETGQTPHPTPKVLGALAEVLDVEPAAFLDEEVA